MTDSTGTRATCVRLPEDIYAELKDEAWRSRQSMAAVVTEALVLRLRMPGKDTKLPAVLARLGYERGKP